MFFTKTKSKCSKSNFCCLAIVDKNLTTVANVKNKVAMCNVFGDGFSSSLLILLCSGSKNVT